MLSVIGGLRRFFVRRVDRLYLLPWLAPGPLCPSDISPKYDKRITLVNGITPVVFGGDREGAFRCARLQGLLDFLFGLEVGVIFWHGVPLGNLTCLLRSLIIVTHVRAKVSINHGADETCQVFTGGWLLTVFYSQKNRPDSRTPRFWKSRSSCLFVTAAPTSNFWRREQASGAGGHRGRRSRPVRPATSGRWSRRRR